VCADDAMEDGLGGSAWTVGGSECRQGGRGRKPVACRSQSQRIRAVDLRNDCLPRVPDDPRGVLGHVRAAGRLAMGGTNERLAKKSRAMSKLASIPR